MNQNDPRQDSSRYGSDPDNHLPPDISNTISNVSTTNSSKEKNILSLLQKIMQKWENWKQKFTEDRETIPKWDQKSIQKMVNRGKGTAGHVDAAIIGENFVHNQRQDIRAMPHSKTVWMEVQWVYLDFDGGEDQKWEIKRYNNCVII